MGNLSHFLLTELLLPKLKKTAESDEVRIAILSSSAAVCCKNMDLSKLPTPKDDYDEMADYSVTKAVDAFHARYLQQLLSGSNVFVTSIHPGVVETGLGGGNVGATTFVYKSRMMSPFRRPIAEGAATTMYCTLSTDVPDQVRNGNFFFYNCAPQDPLGIIAKGVREDLCEKLHTLQLNLVKPFM